MKLYRTRTQEEFDWLAEQANDKGYVFYKRSVWEYYRENTVVYYLENDKGYISHEPIDAVRNQYPEEDYPILEVSELMKPKTDAEIMQELIEERNHKTNSGENLLNENDPVDRPTHYESGGKDLFDELYERLYHSKKTFTGREVFIIVMKFVAERYTRRYPNKNAEDLSKGIYTLERLRGYEETGEEE